jgi:hypothetical protein
MSKKGAQGVLERATRDKLITTNGRGVYAVTPRGTRVVAEPTQTPDKQKRRESREPKTK